VEELPVGSRQLVEIAKAISQDASVLILDEPTASLAAAEIQVLTEAVRLLTAEGISVIYISHHLDEVVAICDRVTVLRDGNVTLVAETAGVTLAAIIENMMGRSLESALAYREHDVDRTGQPLLRVAGLRNRRLNDISFDLHRGEIVGVAGLLGSGRSELMRAVFGIDGLDAGTIEIGGHKVDIRSSGDALDAGIALVPEDRGRAGLVREHSVGHNIMMAAWRRFARAGFINDSAARRMAEGFVEQLNIRTTGLDQEVKSLSGGNQQKVVVAKNLSVKPSVLLLDDPTVGVDVGSKREILMEVRELAAKGNGILLVSSEFEELSGVADRVLVIRDGAILRVLDRSAGDDLSEEALSRAVQE
jgi:ribose transport system ATP-binding protein